MSDELLDALKIVRAKERELRHKMALPDGRIWGRAHLYLDYNDKVKVKLTADGPIFQDDRGARCMLYDICDGVDAAIKSIDEAQPFAQKRFV